MGKVRIVSAFLSIALLCAMIGLSTAVPVRWPGVNVGNTFSYGSVSFNWYSDDPNATSTGWEDMNEIEWFSVTVESVVGTNVTGSTLSHFKNTTEVTEGGWVDVDTGDNDNMPFFFVSANLDVNDSIYSGGTYSNWNISETFMKTYPEGSRETNHLNMTVLVSNPPSYNYVSINVYWDRETGLLTEMSMIMNSTMIYTTNWSLSFELTETNLWAVPEFVGLHQALLLLSSLTLVTLVRRRRLHNTQNR